MADPPRPPRSRSPTLDEQIKRRLAQEKAEREAARRAAELDAAEREAARGHHAYEPTFPPPPPPPPPREAWPPRVVAGVGSPSSTPPAHKRTEATHKAFVSVWGIIVILVGAAGGGWSARAFVGDKTAKDELADLRQEIKDLKLRVGMNQETNQVTFGGLKTEIESIQKELRAKQAEPLKPGGRR